MRPKIVKFALVPKIVLSPDPDPDHPTTGPSGSGRLVEGVLGAGGPLIVKISSPRPHGSIRCRLGPML